MQNHLRQARFLLTETDHQRIGPSESEVAFIGRSNVGKSSLLNTLCDHKDLARVSRTPGRTRGINVFEVKEGRWLVDLPGYGFAVGPLREREYWQTMISRYLRERSCLKLVLLLIDAEVGPSALDVDMFDWLDKNGVPALIIATKTDQLKPSLREVQKRKVAGLLRLNPDDVLWVSSLKKWGIEELRGRIEAALGIQN